jgi:excisionase family DNA binding protein
MRQSDQPIALDTRLALRQREAADALGISERKLRQISSRLPAVRIGGLVLYPVEELRRWLREESELQETKAEAMANEILETLRGVAK